MGMFETFGVFGMIWVGLLILILASVGLTVWGIYDVFVNQKKMPDTEKLIWVLVMLFLGIIGVAVYYAVVKAKRKYEEETYEGGDFETY